MKKEKPKYLSVEETIKRAKEENVDFGTGKPYNRLRYYTKLGWIPHMERMGKNVEGHYPFWVINRLKFIQNLKDTGLSNDQITEQINKKEKIRKLIEPLKSKQIQKKAVLIAAATLLAVVLLNEAGILKIGKSKTDLLPQQGLERSVFP